MSAPPPWVHGVNQPVNAAPLNDVGTELPLLKAVPQVLVNGRGDVGAAGAGRRRRSFGYQFNDDFLQFLVDLPQGQETPMDGHRLPYR